MPRGPVLSEGNDLDQNNTRGLPTFDQDVPDPGEVKARSNRNDKWGDGSGKTPNSDLVRTPEEIENRAFWEESPREAPTKAEEAATTEETPEVEAKEEEAKEETEDQPEPEAVSEEADLADATPRQQRRIRELANKKRELETELAASRRETLEVLSRLGAQQERQTQLQQEQWDRQRALLDQQEKAREAQATVAQLESGGFTPEQIQYILGVRQQAEQAKGLASQIEELKRWRENQETQAQIARYEQAMGQHLVQLLAGYNVDQQTLEQLYTQARAVAAEGQIADPAQAVAMALSPILKFLPKKAQNGVKRPPSADPDADRAISNGRGKKGADTAGRSAGGRTNRKTVEEIEKEMGSNHRSRDWGHG